jgi:hypothetical protein
MPSFLTVTLTRAQSVTMSQPAETSQDQPSSYLNAGTSIWEMVKTLASRPRNLSWGESDRLKAQDLANQYAAMQENLVRTAKVKNQTVNKIAQAGNSSLTVQSGDVATPSSVNVPDRCADIKTESYSLTDKGHILMLIPEEHAQVLKCFVDAQERDARFKQAIATTLQQTPLPEHTIARAQGKGHKEMLAKLFSKLSSDFSNQLRASQCRDSRSINAITTMLQDQATSREKAQVKEHRRTMALIVQMNANSLTEIKAEGEQLSRPGPSPVFGDPNSARNVPSPSTGNSGATRNLPRPSFQDQRAAPSLSRPSLEVQHAARNASLPWCSTRSQRLSSCGTSWGKP